MCVPDPILKKVTIIIKRKNLEDNDGKKTNKRSQTKETR